MSASQWDFYIGLWVPKDSSEVGRTKTCVTVIYRVGLSGKEGTVPDDLGGPPRIPGISGVVVGGRVFRSKCLLPLSPQRAHR